MKISIIIPVYNVEPYVERCLRSVMFQTCRSPIECLIVDDCGVDKSMDVVERMVADYHGAITFKIFHHSHNRGLSAARNTGMENATGEYVFFLDSDDEISKDCIEKLSGPLLEEQYDLVVGSMRIIGNCDCQWLMLKLDDGIVLRGKEIEEAYYKKWHAVSCNKLYRTDFLRHQGLRFKEGLVHEDELWSLQIACLAQSLRGVNHFTYFYYVRENSLTTSKDMVVRKSEMQKVIAAEICSFLMERNIFSVCAYDLMQMFFWNSLKPSLYDRNMFVRNYCDLRSTTIMPLVYRIRACGLHPRAQIRNFYYMIPSKVAGMLAYWLNNLK